MKKFIIQCQAYFYSFDGFFRNEKGATAIEYGLIAAGIALAIAAVVFTLGDEVALVFQDVEAGFAGP